MFVIAGHAFEKGDYRRLTRGFDYKGRLCGVDAGVENKRYLYFPNILAPSVGVCLSSCPAKNCTESYTLPDNVTYPCYRTKTVLNRFCFPKNEDDAAKLEESQTKKQVLAAVGDISDSWEVILGCAFVSLALGFTFMVLVRCMGGILTFLLILGTLAGLIILGIFLYKKYKAIMDDPELSKTSADDAQVLLGLSITAFVVAGIFFIVVVALRNRIRLAVTLVQATCRAIFAMPGLVFQPFVSFIFITLYIAYWVAVLIWLLSAGNVQPTTTTIKGVTIQIKTISWDDTLKGMFWYHLFGLFWTVEFLIAIFHFVIAGSVVCWYFTKPVSGTRDDERRPVRPISTSLWYALRYHLGSLAFGSLIVAIVQMARAILAYINEKQKAAGATNAVTEMFFKCMQCCLACFERCLKFINKNAYIQMAIHGTNFFVSCKNAFFLLLRNSARVVALNLVGALFFLLGKFFIALGSAAVGYMILTQVDIFLPGGDKEITTPVVPTAIILILGWIVGSAFMQVFDMGSDTMLQCFCADTEMNGGNLEYTPDELEKFIEEHKNIAEADNRK
eukprot:GILI01001874.1.p2 GENE.GILI01001874.1~~GILI01001874.1.p2  ORF type:complete len:612 (+),score=211.84 GILI01001874.1:159-1838(+)